MIVLHAGFHEDSLFLWGESPKETYAVPAKRRGRKAETSGPELLPYDTAIEGLIAALKEAGIGSDHKKRDKESMTAWLPTAAGKPIASSPLVAAPPKSRAKPSLLPWAVTALRLSAEETIELLCTCVGKEVIAPGVVISKDLAFWAAAMRFAGALVAHQQYFPDISEEDGIHRARWKPAIVGKDAERVVELAKSMPSVCRALSRASDSAPEISSFTVLTRFVDGVLDHLVRTSAREEPFRLTSRISSGRTTGITFASVHDQWMAALRSPDGRMEGESEELTEFAAQVREWQRPVRLSTSTPFRLCFRLEEPDGDYEKETREQGRDAWNVRYLLQDLSDPSLLIPLDDAWRGKGHTVSIFKRRGFKAREYILLSLGQASGICPEIEASLKTGTPSAGTSRLWRHAPRMVDTQRDKAAPHCPGQCKKSRHARRNGFIP
jgi:hypothetical protein